jgi:cell division transport system ATP-binding protein
MIEANNVSLRYPNQTLALKDINLRIEKGQLVFISGPSGSGKTSLLKLFMGIEYPTTGSLFVLDKYIAPGTSKEIQRIRQKIGPVFQGFRLVKGRTALENVMAGMRFLHMSDIKTKAIESLVRVGLENKLSCKVENLSWGEAQRVAIARAVARQPSLILADEPTGNLDKANAIKIFNLLASFRDDNTTVIITTHATHLIENNEDAIFITMDSGSISMDRVVKP